MSTLKRVGMMYTGCYIPITKIIVFPQVRKTFEKDLLNELADDIATNGIIYPPVFAKLSKENFLLYKKAFESISNHALGDIESFPVHEGWYYCLIAGERRYRSHKLLWENGCTKCNHDAQLLNRKLEKGECYRSHYGDDEIEIRACLNIDPLAAKSIQFRENNHVRPPFHEEADDYEQFFRHLRIANPKLSFTEFAKIVGVSTEKVRKALWFRELPEGIQDAARQGFISYSNAIELRKINDAVSLSPEKRLRLLEDESVYLLMHPRMKHEEYRKRLKARLEDLANNTLFDVTPFIANKQGKRKIVQEHMLPHLTLMAQYMHQVEILRKRGLIGKEKLFSGLSPTRQVKIITDQLQLLIPGFILTSKQLKTIKGVNFELNSFPQQEAV